jgi:tRNA splicing ligase
MPRFDVDAITIDPDEYVSACGEREIEELLDEIRRTSTEVYDEFIESDIEEAVQDYMDESRSDGQRIFNYHLNYLKSSWYSVIKEDADIIAILAKKYGSV